MNSLRSKAAGPPLLSSGSSFISNTFAYFLPLKDLLEMLTSAQHSLRSTNQILEGKFPKSSLSILSLSTDNFLDQIWYKHDRQSNRVLLYSIYGYKQNFPIKAGIAKRNELIGHLNIMTMGLSQKIKETLFDDTLYYSTEEDLFNSLLKVFHSKLFESPVFRKVPALANFYRFAAKYGK